MNTVIQVNDGVDDNTISIGYDNCENEDNE